jgi:hypothetical protein
VEVIGPDHVAGNPSLVSPGLLLTLEVAIADVGEAKRAGVAFEENLGDGAAYGAKAYQSNPARRRVVSRSGKGGWRTIW